LTGVIAGASLAVLLAYYVFLIQADNKKKHQREETQRLGATQGKNDIPS
jgi:hypothetical protein